MVTKKILIFLGLLLLIFAAGVFYQRFTKPSPSHPPKTNKTDFTITDTMPPGWKLYTNKKYGYSLKYPGYLNIVPQDEFNQHVFSITNKPHPKEGLYARKEDEPYYGIDVMVTDADGETTADIAKYFDGYKNRKDYTRKDFLLGGVKGYYATDVSLDSLTNAVAVIKNGKTYFVGFRYFKTKKPDGEAVFQQILSSFTFL